MSTMIESAVRHVIWTSAAGDAAVVRLASGDTACGPVLQAAPKEGVVYQFFGKWNDHPKYGRQFRWETYILPGNSLSLSGKAVIAYLSQNCDGIAEGKASKLLEAYGGDAVRILRKNPERVVADGLLSQAVAMAASETLKSLAAWEDTRAELAGMLAGRGFQIKKVIEESIRLWGRRAVERIRRDPFQLMLRRVPSAGFLRCDQLYLDLGHPPNRLKRQLLAAQYWLLTHGGGSTWHKAEAVGQAILQYCPEGDPVQALRFGIRSRILVSRKAEGTTWIAEASQAANEALIAEKARRLNRRGCHA